MTCRQPARTDVAFNLLQLFIYRRLKRPRRPKDPTDTIRHIVERGHALGNRHLARASALEGALG